MILIYVWGCLTWKKKGSTTDNKKKYLRMGWVSTHIKGACLLVPNHPNFEYFKFSILLTQSFIVFVIGVGRIFLFDHCNNFSHGKFFLFMIFSLIWSSFIVFQIYYSLLLFYLLFLWWEFFPTIYLFDFEMKRDKPIQSSNPIIVVDFQFGR